MSLASVLTVHLVVWEQKNRMDTAGIAILLIFLAKQAAVQAVITQVINTMMKINTPITASTTQSMIIAILFQAVHANIKELCLMPELFFVSRKPIPRKVLLLGVNF